MNNNRNVIKSFVSFRRTGNTVTPTQARVVQSAKGWKDGKPYGVTTRVEYGNAIPWPELYGGHTQWVADQIDRTRNAIKAERTRRAERKQVVA